MSDGAKGWGENDRKWRRNCSNWVAAKSDFEGFSGALQGLKPFGFAVLRCVAVEIASYKTFLCDHWCDAGLGAKIGRIAT